APLWGFAELDALSIDTIDPVERPGGWARNHFHTTALGLERIADLALDALDVRLERRAPGNRSQRRGAAGRHAGGIRIVDHAIRDAAAPLVGGGDRLCALRRRVRLGCGAHRGIGRRCHGDIVGSGLTMAGLALRDWPCRTAHVGAGTAIELRA